MFAILLCWAVMRVWFFFLLFSLASTHWLWKIIPFGIIIDKKSYTYLRSIYFFSLVDHVSHLQSDQKRSKSKSRRTHACKKRQCYNWTPHKKVRRSVLFQVYVRRQFWHFVTNLYARKSGSLINWVIPTRKTPFSWLFGWFSFFIFK